MAWEYSQNDLKDVPMAFPSEIQKAETTINQPQLQSNQWSAEEIEKENEGMI